VIRPGRAHGLATVLVAPVLAATVLAATVLAAVVLSACGSSGPAAAPGTAPVVSAPVRVAHTRLGAVGYRVVGSGPPLVLIMGYGWNMEAAVAAYPPAAPAATVVKASQASAESDWWYGHDAAGHQVTRIAVPTLVADGTADQLDPAANDRTLARLIPRARLVFYPGAGHAFLFQDQARFAALVGSFLAASP